jgi:hypothetical protein
MTFSELQAAVAARQFPAEASDVLRALYLVATGHWSAAHEVVQTHDGHAEFDRVHAYLHRHDEDLSNARYWYTRVGEAMPEISLDEEWRKLAMRYANRNIG